MKNSTFLLLISLSFLFWQCGDKAQNSASETSSNSASAAAPQVKSTPTGGTTINGKIEGASDMQVFFDKSGLDNRTEVVGKVNAGPDGSFAYTLDQALEPAIYRIRIGAQKIFLPFNGTEKAITVNGNLTDFNRYNVDLRGSESASFYVDAMKAFYAQELDQKTALERINQAPEPIAALQLAFATQGGITAKNISLHKSILGNLKNAYPNAAYADQYTSLIQQAEQQIAAQKAAGAIQVGMPAPDIMMQDVNGKTRKLSDLKGKVVLLDFWASWCGPCRRANPHVVEAYDKYNLKGFEVFSVSLDGINPRMLPRIKSEEEKQRQLESAKNRWIAAIEKDNLKWSNHVSDLQHWNSPITKVYGVRSIPKTFLIDRDGNIAMVGVNPLSMDIEAEIQKLL